MYRTNSTVVPLMYIADTPQGFVDMLMCASDTKSLRRQDLYVITTHMCQKDNVDYFEIYLFLTFF